MLNFYCRIRDEALPVVTVMSITSVKPGRKVYPTEVFLKSGETGLSRDSIAMAHQIRAISRERLGEKCGSVESQDLKDRIKDAVKLYFDL